MCAPDADPELCARCQGALAGDEGYCAPCHWEITIELDRGHAALAGYLANWAGFSDWLEVNGPAT